MLTPLLQRHSQLRGTVLGKPQVPNRARTHIAEMGLAGRWDVVAGDDFFAAVPPAYVHLSN